MEDKKWKTIAIAAIFVAFLAILLIGVPYIIKTVVEQTMDRALSPVSESGAQLGTQVASILHPTPTIRPDPTTIIHELRALARLETIQYSVEKVITAETGQGQFGFLFGDKLLLVAHGTVIAGVDLNRQLDIRIEEKRVFVHLPEPEIFMATIDNQKSYIYDRETGLLTKGDPNLESSARKVAEEEIRKAALEDGILNIARTNAENYISRLLHGMGFENIQFTYDTILIPAETLVPAP